MNSEFNTAESVRCPKLYKLDGPLRLSPMIKRIAVNYCGNFLGHGCLRVNGEFGPSAVNLNETPDIHKSAVDGSNCDGETDGSRFTPTAWGTNCHVTCWINRWPKLKRVFSDFRFKWQSCCAPVHSGRCDAEVKLRCLLHHLTASSISLHPPLTSAAALGATFIYL